MFLSLLKRRPKSSPYDACGALRFFDFRDLDPNEIPAKFTKATAPSLIPRMILAASAKPPPIPSRSLVDVAVRAHAARQETQAPPNSRLMLGAIGGSKYRLLSSDRRERSMYLREYGPGEHRTSERQPRLRQTRLGKTRYCVAHKIIWPYVRELAARIEPDCSSKRPPTLAERVVLTEIVPSFMVNQTVEKGEEIGTLAS